MHARITLLLAATGIATACAPIPAPTTPDLDPPQVMLQVAQRSFRSEEMGTPFDACVEVRRFPVLLTVSASDRGSGLASVGVGSLPAEIGEVSVAPESAAIERSVDRATHRVTVRPRPPAAEVQLNLLLTLTVDEPSAILVEARDNSRHLTELFQVDLIPADDPRVCRGEPIP